MKRDSAALARSLSNSPAATGATLPRPNDSNTPKDHEETFADFHSAFALTTAPLATANCDPLPTLEISFVRTTLVGNEWKEGRAIDATATKDGKSLPLAIVRLYIGKVLVQWTKADKRGHFLLEPLTVGRRPNICRSDWISLENRFPAPA